MLNLAQLGRERAAARCRSFSLLLMDSLATGHRVALWRVPCNSWSCPRCAPKKARAISQRARHNFRGHRLRFLTLTLRPQGDIPGSITHINRAYNRLRTNIVRKFGKVKYFKVLEFQRHTKMPHLHVLVDKFIPKAWLITQIQRAGFGPIFKIKRVRDDLVYGYALKYLTKGITDDECESALLSVRGRRYSFSQHLAPPLRYYGLMPVQLFRHGDSSLLSALMYIYWLDISISSGYFPLDGNIDFCGFRVPARVPLLPAPPSVSGRALGPAMPANAV